MWLEPENEHKKTMCSQVKLVRIHATHRRVSKTSLSSFWSYIRVQAALTIDLKNTNCLGETVVYYLILAQNIAFGIFGLFENYLYPLE
jgi:hypothetical protein